MSVLADLPTPMPEPEDASGVDLSPDVRAVQWLDLAERANVLGGCAHAEIALLALATIPNLEVLHGMRWVFDSFEALCTAVADLDDAQQERLLVDEIDPDGEPLEPGDDRVLDLFLQEVMAALEALLSGPVVEVR